MISNLVLLLIHLSPQLIALFRKGYFFYVVGGLVKCSPGTYPILKLYRLKQWFPNF